MIHLHFFFFFFLQYVLYVYYLYQNNGYHYVGSAVYNEPEVSLNRFVIQSKLFESFFSSKKYWIMSDKGKVHWMNRVFT